MLLKSEYDICFIKRNSGTNEKDKGNCGTQIPFSTVILVKNILIWRITMSEKTYKYETHMHTSQASACGQVDGATQARIYKELGYTGVVVTDHFFNGNTCVPRSLPWEERVTKYCDGYRAVKEEGDKIGLQVFFGMETNYNSMEFLIYGLSEEWLKAHPDMLSWSVEKQYEMVHEAGGLVVQAHPFRKAPHISNIVQYPHAVDAMEGYNGLNENGGPEFNNRAVAYCKEHGITMTGGSDAHKEVTLRGGLLFKEKWNDIYDFIRAVKNGEGYEIITQFEKK